MHHLSFPSSTHPPTSSLTMLIWTFSKILFIKFWSIKLMDTIKVVIMPDCTLVAFFFFPRKSIPPSNANYKEYLNHCLIWRKWIPWEITWIPYNFSVKNCQTEVFTYCNFFVVIHSKVFLLFLFHCALCKSLLRFTLSCELLEVDVVFHSAYSPKNILALNNDNEDGKMRN